MKKSEWISIFFLQVFTIGISGYLFSWWSPWLFCALSSFFWCRHLFKKKISYQRIVLLLLALNCVAGYLLWFIASFLIDLQGGGLLSSKIGLMVGLSGKLGGYFITALIGAILTSLGSIVGCVTFSPSNETNC